MRATLLLLVALGVPAWANQTVWKWVDQEGVTHYSDRPMPGATPVQLRTSGNVATPPPAASSSGSTTSQEPSPAGALYTDFEILRPAQDETIPNTGGQVDVNLRLSPALRPGHSIFLYLDGRLLEGLPTDAIDVTLTEVSRGTHTLVAVITGPTGRLQESAPVQFHVRQTSVAQPPVGPALRPAPRPQRTSNKPASSQPSYAALHGSQPDIDPATNAPRVRKSWLPELLQRRD